MSATVTTRSQHSSKRSIGTIHRLSTSRSIPCSTTCTAILASCRCSAVSDSPFRPLMRPRPSRVRLLPTDSFCVPLCAIQFKLQVEATFFLMSSKEMPHSWECGIGGAATDFRSYCTLTVTVVVFTIAPVAASVPVTVKVKAPVPSTAGVALPPQPLAPAARATISRASIAKRLRRRVGKKKKSSPASTVPPAVPIHPPL